MATAEAEMNKNYATDTTRNSDKKQKLEISRRLESSLKQMEISTKNLLRKARERLDEPREGVPSHASTSQTNKSAKLFPKTGQTNQSAIQLNSSSKSGAKALNKFRSGNNKRINPILKNEKGLLERKKKIVEKRLEAFSINHGEKRPGNKNKSFTR